MAMFSGHGGLVQDHNLTDEQRARREAGERVYYDDPKEIVMVNQKTGQRFKIEFPEEDETPELARHCHAWTDGKHIGADGMCMCFVEELYGDAWGNDALIHFGAGGKYIVKQSELYVTKDKQKFRGQ